jgi:hypothetical protein
MGTFAGGTATTMSLSRRGLQQQTPTATASQLPVTAARPVAATAAAAATAPLPGAATQSTAKAGSAEVLPGQAEADHLYLPANRLPATLGPVLVPATALGTLSPTNKTTQALNATLARAALLSPLNASTNINATADQELAAANAALRLQEPTDGHQGMPTAFVPVHPEGVPGNPIPADVNPARTSGSTVSPRAATPAPAAATNERGQVTAALPVPLVGTATATATAAATAIPPLNADRTRGAKYRNGSTGPNVITIVHFNDWHQRMEPMKDYAHALCDRTQADSGALQIYGAGQGRGSSRAVELLSLRKHSMLHAGHIACMSSFSLCNRRLCGICYLSKLQI